jgi:predicted acylesterase/phospholipase RssA
MPPSKEDIDNRVYVKELSDFECVIVRAMADSPQWLSGVDESALRWALSLARVSVVENSDGGNLSLVDIGHATDVYRQHLFLLLKNYVDGKNVTDPKGLTGQISAIRTLVRNERKELLELYRNSLSAEALDNAVRQRPLALALGGGGGTSFIFVGAFCELEEAGLIPSLITGTSMGALLGAYRARYKNFNLNDLQKAMVPLTWEKVAKPMHLGSRFGLPATFRLYLREVFGLEFQVENRHLRLSDLQIPFRATVSGITHIEGQPDPDFSAYEHLLDNVSTELSNFRVKQKGMTRALLDLAKKPLQAIYLGRDEITSEFDVLDAVGFSAAVPGLFQYDISQNDPRMLALTAKVLKHYGVLRLFDGGFVDNLPAKEAQDAIQSGAAKGRDPFVLALDAFAPNLHAHWLFLPLMRAAAENSREGRKVAHLTITYRRVLSPLNMVPTKKEFERVVSHGREETIPHMSFIQKILGPIPAPPGVVSELDGEVSVF